ncbi:MAG: ATP-binding cassette domain-containing protein, partial [Mesorhizobium sp.]
MKYGRFTALHDVSIDVEAGEFLALLGPSGSGKSTMLMAIGGFNIPTSGDVIINDEVVTQKAPHLRNVGIVFQRYALFPHMTVWENVAYPLRRRRIASAEVAKEVTQALEMVSLETLAHRFPAELSGGQQQRVALARALVFHPPVLLMDEPLGALDRKLRQQLQMELKKLHRSLGTTIILVTHDQEEALSMADRVAVMAEGRLLQIGTPTELYCHPNSPF